MSYSRLVATPFKKGAPIDRLLNLLEDGMPRTLLLAGICWGLSLACSDAAAPRPTPSPPANVMIVELVTSSGGSPFMIKVRNEGGAGSFYLRFRYGPTEDVPALGETEVLNISAGSELTRSYDVLDVGDPDVVSVFTRDAGARTFLQTDCKAVRAGFTCNGLWDY